MLTSLKGKSLTCIYGPPGTGKTSAILKVIDQEIRKGVPTNGIGCFSFTKRASVEIRSRLGIAADKFPFCRTLHSMAFVTLGLRKTDMMQTSDWIALSRNCGFPLFARDEYDSEPRRLISIEAQARSQGVDPVVFLQGLPTKSLVRRQKLEKYARELERYKNATNRFDYTDLIHAYVRKGEPADLPVIIVDEAQDLSSAQWSMLRKLCETAKRIYLAGDDDQSIYQWAGADATEFVRCHDIGQDRVLDISYRVPERVQELALQIVRRIEGNRVDKTWKAKPELGDVRVLPDPWQLDIDLNETWLVLARSSQLLHAWCQWAVCHGIPFICKGFHSPGYDPDLLQAALTWRRLKSGERASVLDVGHLYAQFKGRKLLAYGAMSRLETVRGERGLYLDELYKDYGLLVPREYDEESLFPEASTEQMTYLRLVQGRHPVRVSTIHGAKGAEADNVILFTDMPPAATESMYLDPDSEHRCWYVAVTRAAKRLFLIRPQDERTYYPFST